MTIRSSSRDYTVDAFRLAEPPDEFSEAIVVTDTNLAQAYPDLLAKAAGAIVVPAGEESKAGDVYLDVVNQVAERGLRRDGTLVALGGGVVGDLAGFVAATYMRGVRLLQVPTSLLAMVDSSVGGKVGIDLPAGKNLLGAFWPPHQVLVDPAFLSTLPPSEFANGMAEVIKYGFIMDAPLLNELNRTPLQAEDPRVGEVIWRCIDLKRQVVEADEHETNGVRATLNFGHTMGHALEQVTGYATYRHGEAVGLGMIQEVRLGERLGLTPPGLRQELTDLLAAHGLPTRWPQHQSTDDLVAAMARDKKADRSGLAFSLITGRGGCKLVRNVPVDDVRATLESA